MVGAACLDAVAASRCSARSPVISEGVSLGRKRTDKKNNAIYRKMLLKVYDDSIRTSLQEADIRISREGAIRIVSCKNAITSRKGKVWSYLLTVEIKPDDATFPSIKSGT